MLYLYHINCIPQYDVSNLAMYDSIKTPKFGKIHDCIRITQPLVSNTQRVMTQSFWKYQDFSRFI